MSTMPLEADTRLLIDTNLKNLGWSLTGRDKNVFLEQPRSEAERRKLGGKRPDYVLYSKESEKPLIIIEAKKRGARIDTALEQGIYYAKILEAPLVFATDGVFCKAFHTMSNRVPMLNGEEVDEFMREALALKYLASGEVNTISPKVQYDRKELIKIFDEANNMLRGDGLRAGIERFGEFANILFLKLISESEQIKYENGVNTDFDTACSWDSIKKIPLSTRIEYVNKTVYEKLNGLYKTEIFTPLTIRDENIFKEIMDKLDPLMLTDVDSDVKGDAFEYFLKASTSSKNDLGEYFTPRHIVKTMVRLVNPQIGEKVYDPFCGTGGFLIESFRYIYNNMARTKNNLKTLREQTIFGNEITNTARITKMNMILAGDGHSNIHMMDSLANPVDGTETYENEHGQKHHCGFDVVLANMPYSQKTKHGYLYDLPSTNGDSICVQHCMKAINKTADNGRMALVVPEGFLFRKDLTNTRKYFLQNCQLQSIISLPQGVFLPYTGVKTNIIYATKVNQKSHLSGKKYWYFKVKSDGYTLDNHRRKMETSSDLSEYEEYRKLDKDQTENMLKVGFEIIPFDKVCNNSFILLGSRYKTLTPKVTNFPLVSLGDDKYFSIYSGGTPSSSNPQYWGGSINWITLVDLPSEDFVTKINKTKRTITTDGLNNSSAKLLPVNTIVVSSRATIGRIGIAKTELATNQGFKNIVIKDPSLVLPEYLAFILTAKKDVMLSMASGATFKEISKKNFETIQVPLPSFEKQVQIVEELDKYQEIVNHARGLVNNYCPSFYISEKWEISTLGELFEISLATIDPKVENGMVNFVGLENIEAGTGKIIGQIKCNIQDIKSRKRIFKKGDILFGKLRPALNKVAVASFGGICSTDIVVLSPKGNDILPKFYSILLRNNDFYAMVLDGVSGGQLPRVDLNYLMGLPIQKVPVDAQNTILAQIEVEENLIAPSEQIISVFTEKIRNKIASLWND